MSHMYVSTIQELRYGGFVAPNIYYMGDSGVVRVGGLRVGGLSGIFNGKHYRVGHYEVPPYSDSDIRSVYHTRQLEVYKLDLLAALASLDGSQPSLETRGQKPVVDVFVSHDWPCGITRYGNEQKLVRAKKFFAKEVQENK
jgi:lariat debranching enzyme